MIDFDQNPEWLSAALQAHLGLEIHPVFLVTRHETGTHWHFFNPAFQKISGREALEVRDLDINDLFSGYNQPQTSTQIASLLRDGGVFMGPCRIGEKNGRIHSGELIMQVDQPDEKKRTAVFGLFLPTEPVETGEALGENGDYRQSLSSLRALLGSFLETAKQPHEAIDLELANHERALECWLEDFSHIVENPITATTRAIPS